MQQEDELFQKLRSLAPRRTSVDPIAAAFTAGKNSRRGQVVVWRGIGVAAVLLLGAMWFNPPASVRAPASFTEPVAAPERGPLSDGSAIRLEQAILNHGPDGLPEPDSMTLRQSDKSNSL